MPGKVYLIGMGPGDAELITLKAINAIKSCDVLVYDRLLNKELLKHNTAAERIYVGKQSGNHTMSQDDINALLVNKAMEGFTVGRLKGGDPYVFGRGGEEAIALGSRGIEYELIPGITSAIAAPMYAGIPVTHRGIATSFHVITGHEYSDKSDIDWEALARLKGTLVFLMGIENLEMIVENLIKYGKNADCPAALVMNGTRYNQKAAIGSLCSIVDKCKENEIKSPAIIIIGEVVQLAESLGRSIEKPLKDLRIMSTRPYDKSEELIMGLKEQGARVYSYPCIEVSGCKDVRLDKNELEAFDALVFSSSYGVEYFLGNLRKNLIDIRCIKGELFGVGPSIKQKLEAYGLFGSNIPDKFNSKELAILLNKNLEHGSKVLIVCGNIGSEDLIAQLANHEVTKLVVYNTYEGNDESTEEDTDAIVFTSPSGVRGFVKSTDVESFKSKLAVCIGESTKQQAEEAGFNNILMPDNSEIEEIIRCLIEWRYSNA